MPDEIARIEARIRALENSPRTRTGPETAELFRLKAILAGPPSPAVARHMALHGGGVTGYRPPSARQPQPLTPIEVARLRFLGLNAARTLSEDIEHQDLLDRLTATAS